MPENEPDMGAAQQDTPGTDWAAEAAKWKALARKHESQWKDVTAQLDAATQHATDTDAKLQSITAERDASALAALRYEVAAEKQLPLTAVQNLTGADRDALVASADNLLSTINAVAAAQTAPAAPPPIPVTPDPGNPAEAAQAFLGGIFD